MSTGTVVHRHPPDEAMSETVVYAVAEHTGTDPRELDPINDVVDPDALNRLFESGQADGDRGPERVTFTYGGCTVTISADGRVHVSGAGQESRPSPQPTYP